MSDDTLKKEDYTDPQCPFCVDEYKNEPPVKRVPADRILQKADEYFSRDDYDGAERHYLYWLEEAKTYGDDRGAFTIYNELMGLYRKTAQKDKALEALDRAMGIIAREKMDGSISSATAYVNAGTVLKSFNLSDEAMPYFEKAKKIYEESLKGNDGRLGGLYNNMALALTDLKKYDEALSYYNKAIDVMKQVQHGELEWAITLLNIANLKEWQLGLENAQDEISSCLEKAEELLNTPDVPRNGYYAFVCEKCAPTFDYYGYFMVSEDLKSRAKEIYERT